MLRVLLLLLVLPSLVKARDLGLNDVVRLALERNPVVLEAKYREQVQRFREKESFSALFPKLEFGYVYTHLKEEPYSVLHYRMPQMNLPFPITFPKDQKVKIGEHQDVKWDITATWPLFTGFYLTTLNKIEKLGVGVLRFRREAIRLQVAHAARVAYYQVLVAQKNLDTARESVRQLEAHLRDAESFYEEGLVPYNDVLKARVALAKAVQERTRAEEALETAWVNLNLVIRNDDPFEHYTLVDGMEGSVKRPAHIKALVELALTSRPDVKAAELAVRQAELNVKAAKSRYYPWITIFSSYQQHGDNLLANNNDYTNRENFAVGVRVDLLVFDFFGRKYRVHQARSAVLVQESVLSEVRDRVVMDVRKAYADTVVALRNIETARRVVEQAREDLRITRLQYAQQIASSSDVIDSENAYIEALNRYHSALYSYRVALSALATACGVVDVERVLGGENGS